MSTGPQRVAGTALVGWATPLRFHSLQDDFTILGSKPQSLSPRRALLGAKTLCHGESLISWLFLCLGQKYRQCGVVSNVRSQSGLPHSRTRGLKYGSA